MKDGPVSRFAAYPTIHQACFVVIGTGALALSLNIMAGYQPDKTDLAWVVGLTFAGLSGFLDMAPPFVVRAQVVFENERSADTYTDVSIVFEEECLVPGLLSQVVGRAAVL